ncbi:MAG: hypothetical protein M1365_11885, partial [Actinobacteria bacterium]|nr:hypothetical protein [Actinomycetota bacterium]
NFALSKKAVGLKEDVLTEEDLDYIYGQTSHPDFPTLSKDAEKWFREGLDEKNEQKRAKLIEKRNKRLEKYEKEKNAIYKNPDRDPIISHLYGIIETHASLKYLYLTKIKKQKDVDYSKIRDEIKLKAWIGFISRYPTKAKEYRNRKYAKAKCYKDLIQAWIQLWHAEQQSSQATSNIPDNLANRQADEIVKKELQKQKASGQSKEEQAPAPTQQNQNRKFSTRTINEINRLASRFMQPPQIPQSFPESPPMEPPGPSQRPSGPTSRAINGANRLVRAGNPLNKLGGSLLKQGVMTGARSLIAVLWPWILLIIGIILLVVIILAIIGIKPDEKPKPEPGGDISTCTFYRGGDLVQGTKFGNPQMAATISEISGKVGVPSAIVAGIMRVETAQAITTTDTTYLVNDYDAHTSGVAYGVMQFTPGTFLYTYNTFQDDLKNLFGKISSKISIDLQSNMAPASSFRIYSIRDSITAAAYKVKNDKKNINKDGPWDEETVKGIAERYYGCRKYGPGGCTSGPFDYGEDLWKSFTNCNSVSNPPPPALAGKVSCPLQGSRSIGCGSFMSDPKYNRGSCSGPQPTDRGHCGKNYQSSCSYKGNIDATNSTRRAHSIDVDGPAGENVYLPTINGQSVDWTYQPSASYPIAPGDGGGYGHVFTSHLNGDIWTIHLIHTNPPPIYSPPQGRIYYKSGDAVTKIASTSYTHLHINIGKNPERADGGKGWLNPEDLGICTE